MRPVLIACAILCVLLAVFIGLVTFFTSALEGGGIDFLSLGSAVVFLALAVLSSFGASVIYWLEMQVKTMKELHSAIVASAKGEEPSLPTVEDNEVPTIPEGAKGPTKYTPATGKSAAKLRSDLGV